MTLTLKQYLNPSLISSTSSMFAKQPVERICPLQKRKYFKNIILNKLLFLVFNYFYSTSWENEMYSFVHDSHLATPFQSRLEVDISLAYACFCHMNSSTNNTKDCIRTFRLQGNKNSLWYFSPIINRLQLESMIQEFPTEDMTRSYTTIIQKGVPWMLAIFRQS